MTERPPRHPILAKEAWEDMLQNHLISIQSKLDLLAIKVDQCRLSASPDSSDARHIGANSCEPGQFRALLSAPASNGELGRDALYDYRSLQAWSQPPAPPASSPRLLASPGSPPGKALSFEAEMDFGNRGSVDSDPSSCAATVIEEGSLSSFSKESTENKKIKLDRADWTQHEGLCRRLAFR